MIGYRNVSAGAKLGRSPKSRRFDWYDIEAIVAFGAAFAVILGIAAGCPARAHEAPTGWKYPAICCSNKDCKQVSDISVKPQGSGWFVEDTGEFIAHGDKRLRDSPDGLFHRCAAGANFGPDGHTLCLFVPPMGF